MKLTSSTRSKKKARIEIIPLIDIMFFLLATFVLVSFSMTENRGLRVNLPTSKSSDKGGQEKAAKEKSITISILESGAFALDKKEYNLESLKAELLKSPLDKETQVILLGDKESNLQNTISILDLTKELNLESVTLRTRSNSTSPNQ